MAIPDALSRHYVVYCPEEPDEETAFMGSLVTAALDYKYDHLTALLIQDDLMEFMKPNSADFDEISTIRTLPLRISRRKAKPQHNTAGSCGGPQLDGSQTSVSAPAPTLAQETVSTEPVEENETDDQDSEPMSLSRLALEQRGDPQLLEIIDYTTRNMLPKTRTQAKYVAATSHQYIIDAKGVLRKIDVRTPKGGRGPPAVLPRVLWDEILNNYHKPTLSGHRKYKPLLAAISLDYYFPGMTTYIRAYCDACVVCQRTSFGKGRLAELKPYYASYPGVLVHVDCTPGSCLTKSGNSHIMAIIDSFSGHVQLYAIPQPDSRVAARVLMRYISIHSMPLKIVTDNCQRALVWGSK